jgi:hypothetical protein
MNQQIETAVQPLLTKGEEVRRSGPAWAVEQRGPALLLFRARDLHHVVLTDQRLILLTRPRRRRPLGVNNLVIAKKYSTFSLEKARRLRPMLQLRVRTAEGRLFVLEFRPRDRKVGRELADRLTSNGAVASAPSTVWNAIVQAGDEVVQPRAAEPVRPAPVPVAPPPAVPAAAPVPAPSHPSPGTEWEQDDLKDEARERERRTRKGKRAAKKQAKAEQARKGGNLSRRERRPDAKAGKDGASDHDDMPQNLQK